MPIRARENVVSAWAFLIGIILAIIVGLFSGASANPIVILIVVILGLIVGIFVSEKDVQTFLWASVSVVLASFAGIQGMATDVAIRGVTVRGIEIGRSISSILGALLFLFVPATVVVAIKTVFSLSTIRTR
jgi:hypothetical protein